MASAKSPTVHADLLSGIRGALAELPRELLAQVERVGLSTTLATNAFVEHKGRPVGLLLMSPFAVDESDYPFRFVRHVAGALTMEGSERQPVCPDEIRAVSRQALAAGCEAIAVSGFGGVVNPSHERQVADIALETTGLHAVCGHELTSRLNFTERATTAAMNARLVPLVESLIESVEKALAEYGLTGCRIMMVKGDGSQMLASAAKATPVETVLSGPAASVVGAARITGCRDAVVADMGGTTLDVAILRHGLPAMREEGARIGDFATSVAAMAVQTVGLGGDSEIDLSGWPRVTIGPRRVAPLCRLDELASGYAARYVEELADSISRASGSADVVALVPGTDPAGNRVLSQLADGPLLLGVLARRLNRAQPEQLNWRDLESEGRLLRYGLTLTDILHAEGTYQRFSAEPAVVCLKLWSLLLETSTEELTKAIYQEFRRLVADTVLRAALPSDCPWTGTGSAALRRWLTDHFAAGDASLPLAINLGLGMPLVGVGAPSPTLFPQLGKVLGCEVLVSEYSGVANAIGAIAGDVLLRETATIRMPDDGAFVCSWRGGSRRANNLDEALAACEKALCQCLREQAEANEVPYTEPAFSATPSQAETREGSLLLGVTLVGELRG
jgi:N-methylhydantoinase A/oxoprolinase/acetone carboxylase beta subunit